MKTSNGIKGARSTSTTRRRKGMDKHVPKVNHDYIDHYFDPWYQPNSDQQHDAARRRGPRGGVVSPFPERLHLMLSQSEEKGFESIVGWQPHGRCFIIHKPQEFVEKVMPKYFHQSKLTSFQRQVNLYGFKRITTGADRGAYYHELFLYGRPDLIQKITRIRIKGTGCKAVSSPETEPNFYTQYYSCLENTVGNRDDDNTGENGRAMSTSESRDQHQPEPIFVNGYSCIRSCQVPNEKENIKSTGAGDDSGVGDSFSLLKTIKQFPQPTMSGFFASPPPLPQASAFCTLEPVGSYPQDFSQHSDNAMQGQQNEDLTPYPLSSGRSNLNSIQDEVISLMSDIGYGGTDSGGHGDENFATFSSEFASMDPLFMLEDSFPTETL